jgi:hypothetical protein
VRDSLRRSIEHSPAEGFERYPKGSIVLCNACQRPIFKLDTAISLGDKAGKMASAFKPLSLGDLNDLAEREDIDSGIRAMVATMTMIARAEHIAVLKEMKAGDPMMCPSCADCFVQVISVDKTEALDRSYTIELLTVPPRGVGRQSPVRGKRIGVNHEWIH